MSLRGRSAAHSFPLAANSRARRRLMLFASNNAALKPSDSDATSADSNAEATMHAPRLRIRTTDDVSISDTAECATPSEVRQPVRQPQQKRANGFAAIRRSLSCDDALTWVFAGDGLAESGDQFCRRRSYSEYFSAYVRGKLGRASDVVIDAETSEENSETLLDNLQQRVIRFQPDIVSIMLGANDAQLANQCNTSFRENLCQIITRIQDDGATVLLHTPPAIDPRNLTAYNQLRIIVKEIRETARELRVPCVDHWNHWKKARAKGMASRWLAENGVDLSPAGHRAIAALTRASIQSL